MCVTKVSLGKLPSLKPSGSPSVILGQAESTSPQNSQEMPVSGLSPNLRNDKVLDENLASRGSVSPGGCSEGCHFQRGHGSQMTQPDPKPMVYSRVALGAVLSVGFDEPHAQRTVYPPLQC